MSTRKQPRRRCSPAEPGPWPPWVKASVKNIPNRNNWSITFTVVFHWVFWFRPPGRISVQKADCERMKLLSGQGLSVLFLLQSEEVVLAFSVVRLWSQSLFFSYDSSSWRRQRLPFQQMKPLPFKAKRQTVEERRQQERSMEAVGNESGGKRVVSPTRRSPSAPSFQNPISRSPYSETHLMNTPALIQPHSGALHCHWACSQWRNRSN